MDWIASILTVISAYMLRKLMWQGYAVSLLNQIPWAYLAIVNELYGMLLINVMVAWNSVKGIVEWRAKKF